MQMRNNCPECGGWGVIFSWFWDSLFGNGTTCEMCGGDGYRKPPRDALGNVIRPTPPPPPRPSRYREPDIVIEHRHI